MIRKLLAAAILLAGGLSARADITSNLEAYYNCDEGAGSYYVDSVAGNSLFLVSSGWTTPGKVGSQCANFATSQYASTNTWAGIQGSGAFSTSFWIKTSTGGNQSILSFGHATNSGEAYRVRLESGVLWIRCTGATATVTAATALNDGQWHHVVITQPASATMNQVKFYVDGVNQALTFTGPTQALSRGTTVNLYLSFDFSDSVYFVGQKDDVRFYQRELSASDVLELFVLGSATINDPVAWWKLDETSGTTATDTQGSYNGTYTNSPTLNQTGAFGTSKAVTFVSSSSQQVSLANHGSQTPDQTIAFWFNASDLSGTREIIKNGRTEVRVTPTAVRYYADSGSAGGIDYSTTFSAGTWYHVVISQTSTTATVYRNGVSLGSQSVASLNNSSATAALASGAGTNYFSGTIDDVRIYSRALDAREVYALYQYTDAAIIHSRGRAVNSGAIVQKQTKATIVNR